MGQGRPMGLGWPVLEWPSEGLAGVWWIQIWLQVWLEEGTGRLPLLIRLASWA